MRARNIKPGFFSNEQLVECDPMARLLFIGLWCLADREGRLEDRPKKIKMQIFPADNCDCERLLQQLTNQELIVRYQVEQNRYIAIPTFAKHQRVHANEAPSTIPPFEPIPDQTAKTCHHGEKDLSPREQALRPECLNTECLNTECLNAEVCSEPFHVSEPPPIHARTRARAREEDEPVCTIPTNRYATCKEEFAVTQAFVAELQNLYPAVDVLQELKAIRAWNLTNHTRRKTLSGMPKHINAWLAKAQNRGNGQYSQQPKLVSKVTERNMAVIKAARAMEAQNEQA